MLPLVITAFLPGQFRKPGVMSGASEASAAVMSSREPFTLTPTSHQHPPSSQPQLDQQMRVPYAAEGTYRPVGPSPPFQPGGGAAAAANQVMNSNSGDQKRKRGRPRKYGADGSMAMAMPQPVSVGMPPMENFSPPPTEAQPPVDGLASPSTKKRGRPPGSSNKKKQIEAIGNVLI